MKPYGTVGRRTVIAPDGRTWRVGRRWFGKRIRLRGEDRPDRPDLSDGPDLSEGFDGSSLGDFFSFDDITPAGILAGLAIAVAAAFAVLVVWPVVVLAIELVLLLVVAAATLAGRILFRRPWTVEARTQSPTRRVREWEVVGWRRSSALIDEICTGLADGRDVDVLSAP